MLNRLKKSGRFILLLQVLITLLLLANIKLAAQISLYDKTGDNYFDAIMLAQQKEYQNSNFTAALNIASLAHDYAMKSADEKIKSVSFFHLGQCYTYLNDYSKATHNLDSAFIYASLCSNEMIAARVFYTKATIYNYRSNNAKALEYCLKCDSLINNSKQHGLNKFLPTLYSGMGYIYDVEKQYDKSFIYHKKALGSLHTVVDTNISVMVYQNLFVAYMQQHNYTLAKLYLDSASLLNKNNKGSLAEIYILNNYGLYSDSTGNQLEALNYFLAALKLSASKKIHYFSSTIEINIARVYNKQRKYALAFNYAKNAAETAAGLKNFSDAVTGYAILASMKRKQNLLADAFMFEDSVKLYEDSLNLQNIKRQLVQLEFNEENMKKEKEISHLKISNLENEVKIMNRNKYLLLIGISAVMLLIVFAFSYVRATQKQKTIYLKAQLDKNIAVMSERERIISDLHDDMGATLSSMSIYSELAGNVMDTKPGESRKMMDKISGISKGLMERMGDIIWSMKPAEEDKYTLEARLKNYSNELLSPKGIVCEFDIDAALAASVTTPDRRKNVLLIAKEAINNIAKYSEATKATVSLNQQDGKLLLTISDNGKGFIEDKARPGNGLQNIRQRCHQLNGNCVIVSQTGKGVLIKCIFAACNAGKDIETKA